MRACVWKLLHMPIPFFRKFLYVESRDRSEIILHLKGSVSFSMVENKWNAISFCREPALRSQFFSSSSFRFLFNFVFVAESELHAFFLRLEYWPKAQMNEKKTTNNKQFSGKFTQIHLSASRLYRGIKLEDFTQKSINDYTYFTTQAFCHLHWNVFLEFLFYFVIIKFLFHGNSFFFKFKLVFF